MTQVVKKSAAAGWYATDTREGFRQWWDGRQWHQTFWPAREGLQPLVYAPELPRVDVSSPSGPIVDIVGEAYREAQIVAALRSRPGIDNEVIEVTTAELIPEPDNPHDRNAVAVRVEGYTVGYVSADVAELVQPFIVGIVQRGLVPVVATRIWAVTRNTRRGPELKSAIRIALPTPTEIFPDNHPPAGLYTIVPRGRKIQVTGEDQHLDYLTAYLSAHGVAELLFTLERRDIETRTGIKSVAIVLLDGEVVGELSPTTSKSALPLIDAQHARGLQTAAWGQLTGSRVAAEVTLSLPRATDITDEWLDGAPNIVPVIPREATIQLPSAHAEPAVVPAAPAANSAKWVWIIAVIVGLVLLAIPYVGWVLTIGCVVGAFFLARLIRSRPPRPAIGAW
ncbi:HIRAN domain-containing protein [Microbacterium sp. HJ5]